jgi:RimJ/RimL family protein N-acetyltransferase
MIEIAQGGDVLDAISERLGVAFSEPNQALGYRANGKVLGGVVITGFDGRNADLTVAHLGRGWPVPFIRFIGGHCWGTLELHRVTFITEMKNEGFCARLGASREGVLREWFPHGDAVLMGLLKREWLYDENTKSASAA